MEFYSKAKEIVSIQNKLTLWQVASVLSTMTLSFKILIFALSKGG